MPISAATKLKNRRLALGIFVFAVLLMTVVLALMIRSKYP
jgi:hypothetical protein